jgi:23S rRNA A1618 N6-methylase RlmF
LIKILIKLNLKGINGKLKVNFHDIDAVRALTKACLHRDFNLCVNFPQNKLLPVKHKLFITFESKINIFNFRH